MWCLNEKENQHSKTENKVLKVDEDFKRASKTNFDTMENWKSEENKYVKSSI